MPPGSSSWLVTMLIAATSAAAFQFAVAADGSSLVHVAIDVLPVAAAVLLAAAWRQKTASCRAVLPLALVAVILPFVIDQVGAWTSETNQPLELQLARVLRNLMFVAALCGRSSRLTAAAALASLFLALFAALVEPSAPVVTAVAIYFAAGSWWLIEAHWIAQTASITANTGVGIPKVAACICGLMVVAAVGGAMLACRRLPAEALWTGFVASSGGHGEASPAARSGVGDGDQLVAGVDDARSFGPLESEQFIDADAPSLYDMFNDAYGEPLPSGPQERTVGLAPVANLKSAQGMSQADEAGRDFTTVRKARRETDRVSRDLKSAAVMQVRGRVPLHLRHQTYQEFDGRAWHTLPGSSEARRLSVRREGSRYWIDLDGRLPTRLAPVSERHELRAIKLADNVIPQPVHTNAVQIDRVARIDMYRATESGQLGLDRESIPPSTVIHLESSTVSATRLAEYSCQHWHAYDGGPQPRLATPALSARCTELASHWAAGHPPGWPQVDAVCRKLSAHCTLDRSVEIPPDVADVTDAFLFQSRKGPEYLFATSAARLLGELGYQVRLASGFYARRREDAPRGAHVSVLPEDVHVWCEVTFDGMHWHIAEASPGYDVLLSSTPWYVAIGAYVVATAGWLWERRMGLSTIALAMTGAWIIRRGLIDSLATLTCLVAPYCTRGRPLEWTLWLVQLRSRLAGVPRPSGRTLSQWCQTWCQLHPSDAATVQTWLLSVHQELYGCGVVAESRRHGEHCRAVRNLMTIASWRDPSRRSGFRRQLTIAGRSHGELQRG